MRAYVTVLDGDAELVPYYVRHYSRLGATDFPVTVYGGPDLEDPYRPYPGELERVSDMVREAGGEPIPLRAFASSVFSASNRDKYLRDVHPPSAGWSFFADLDEYAELYPDRVNQLIKTAPRYIAGRWVDRVAPGGKLAALPTPVYDRLGKSYGPYPISPDLEEVYPYGTYTRRQLRAGDYVYVLSPRGPTLHHPNACPWGKKYLKTVPTVTVHHFKWSTNVLERLRLRIQRIDAKRAKVSGVDKSRLNKWRNRVAKTLAYLEKYGGGVDPSKLFYLGPVLGI